MIDLYCDSVIRIVSIRTDKYGAKTQTESADIPARITEYNKIVVNNKGEEVYGEMVIKFSDVYVVNYGDYIKIKKFKDQAYEMPDKLFIVKKIGKPNAFSEWWHKVYI